MFGFIRQRAIASLISLLGLVVLVFFLSRLTGDPAALFLPIDATDEMRRQFREIHGLNDPLAVQFWHYLGDLARLDFGDSLRRARPAIEIVLEAFAWTFQLAVITMAIVTAAASPMVLVPEPGLSAVAAAAPETVSKAEAVGASLRNLLLPLLVASRKQRPTSPASKPSLLSSQQQLRVFCQS